MKTFLSDFNILINKRVVPHHSFTVQLTTISADDDITRNDGTYIGHEHIHLDKDKNMYFEIFPPK